MSIRTIEEAAEAINALQTALMALTRKDVGLIVLSASHKPPVDCIPCDGREYDITDPANAHLRDLFGELGSMFGGDGIHTFKAPELRGEFVRIWDDGHRPDGIVDKNRVLGSFQDWATARPHMEFKTDENGDHDHTGKTDVQSNTHSHKIDHDVTSEGVGNRADGGNDVGLSRRPTITAEDADRDHTHVISMSIKHHHYVTIGGDEETRPRNVALAAYIRF